MTTNKEKSKALEYYQTTKGLTISDMLRAAEIAVELNKRRIAKSFIERGIRGCEFFMINPKKEYDDIKIEDFDYAGGYWEYDGQRYTRRIRDDLRRLKSKLEGKVEEKLINEPRS